MTAINTRIGNLMTFYANYCEANQTRMNSEYGSPEYNLAGDVREMHARWIREELDILNGLGIDMSRFNWIK